MTLEDYIRQQYAARNYDFRIGVDSAQDGYPVRIYIHPLNRNGLTTPSLTVKGNLVVDENGPWPTT